MKTLIITGGSSGIGRATALLFSERGWKVYELSRHGASTDGVVHIDCDVTRAELCREAVAQVLAREQRVDLLISNAGMGVAGSVEFTPDEELHRQMDVNFFGAMNIVRAVLPQMRAQRGGRIIFVSSIAAVFSIPYQAYYSASKAALNAVALALQNEVREFGIDVCCLLPGDVKTGFTAARQKVHAGVEFYRHMQKSIETMEYDEQTGLSPDQMARRLWRMGNSRWVWIYQTTGWYKLLALLEKLLPKTLVNRVVGWLY